VAMTIVRKILKLIALVAGSGICKAADSNLIRLGTQTNKLP
jgi:hypothetical protein